MYVLPISNLIFNSKIIDSHAHVGSLGNQYYSKTNLDEFVKENLPNGDTVEKMLVSNSDVFLGKKSELDGNRELIETFNKDPNYEIFATCSVKNGNVKNIEKLYQENPNTFIGLKFHPTIENVDLKEKNYIGYLDFANKNKIPSLFHCAVAVNSEGKLSKTATETSDPRAIYNLAKKYKDTPIVLAHMGAGWNESHDKAIEVLKESVKNSDANLYADISWVDIDAKEVNGHKSKEHIIKAIKTLKGIGDPYWKYGDQSYRLMFGTDAPVDRFSSPERIKNYTDFIEDIKFAIRNDPDLKPSAEQTIDDLFYNNAQKLYLDNKNKTIKKKKYNRNVTLGIIGITSLALGTIFYLGKKIKNKKVTS